MAKHDQKSKWYKAVVAEKPETVRFSSVRVGAYRVTCAKDGPANKFAVAVCSPNDQFNRRLGQAVALKRLQTTTSVFTGDHHFERNGGGENALEAVCVLAERSPTVFPERFLQELHEELLSRIEA